ncbi:Beta-carotene ketolase [Scenedesmus sp. PABB004]|nr:Beta-carotene ketolase [Scenedesmus sp. PABB004]
MLLRSAARLRPTAEPVARCRAAAAAAAPGTATLRAIAAEHGIALHPTLEVVAGPWGQGLHWRRPHGDAGGGATRLAAVPLRLVLSTTIPGASPGAPAAAPAGLARLLAHPACAEWELQVAALLVWALRLPRGDALGDFWRDFTALLPRAEQLSLLLLWRQAELAELHDPPLAATAAAWQRAVQHAHAAAVAPCLGCTLDHWRWAVAVVESRAFGVDRATSPGLLRARGDGGAAASGPAALVGLVPVLDLANHASAPCCQHGVDAADGTFTLTWCGGSGGGGSGGELCEALITYGDKDNRALMEQYGFTLQGNALDRVEFAAFAQQQQQQQQAPGAASWMAHGPAKAAAARLRRRADAAGDAAAAARVGAALASVLCAAGWRNLEQRRRVTAASTRAAATGLLADVRAQLAAAPASAAADEAELARGGLPPRRRAALAYRLERARLLGAAAELLDETLAGGVEGPRRGAAAAAARVTRRAAATPTDDASFTLPGAQSQRLRGGAGASAPRVASSGQRLSLRRPAAAGVALLGPMAPVDAPREATQQPQPQRQPDAPGGAADADAAVAAVAKWAQQYPLPDERVEGSLPEVKGLYKCGRGAASTRRAAPGAARVGGRAWRERAAAAAAPPARRRRPPRDDVKGVSIALGLIAAWLALCYHAYWQVQLTPRAPGGAPWGWAHWADVSCTFLAIEFVATGLFITTHDAMHGTVCYRSRALNDAIGRVAISLYAWFDYDMLHRNHWAHHNHTGQPGRDPDFHRGNPHIAVWFAQFMLEYSTLLQFAKIFLASTLLQRVGGVPYANLCVYMAAAPILAAFRLFYFGTAQWSIAPLRKMLLRSAARLRPTAEPVARCRAAAAAAAPGTATLRAIAAEHGIALHPTLEVVAGPWGQGLHWRRPHGDAGGGATRLAAVPLRLVLSTTIPGASPGAPAAAPAGLARLLAHPACAEWELQVAALLVWALRLPRGDALGDFWRDFTALLPRAEQLSLLLLWRQAELAELHDPPLAATAAAWQRAVQHAHAAAVAPCLGCTLDHWRWAVAVVESRAFGVDRATSPGLLRARGDGGAAASGPAALVGLVPVLDLANHASAPCCQHGVDAADGTFTLTWCGGSGGGGSGGELCEALITYGDKDNRALMEQYGFTLQGNALDRVEFAAFAQQQQQQQQAPGAASWMAHGPAKAAAARLRRRADAAGDAAAAARVGAALASVLCAAGWRNLEQRRRVTAASTRAAATGLLADVRAQLAAAPASAAADEAELARGGLPPRRRAALAYRLERARLLGAAAELLDETLAGGVEGPRRGAAAAAARVTRRAAATPTDDASFTLPGAQSQRLRGGAGASAPRVASSGQRLSLRRPAAAGVALLGPMAPVDAPREATQQPQPQRQPDAPGGAADADAAVAAVAKWAQQYPLPDERVEGSLPEVKGLYKCGRGAASTRRAAPGAARVGGRAWRERAAAAAAPPARRRRPPRDDVKGVSIALGLIAAWLALCYHAYWQVQLTPRAPGGAPWGWAHWADVSCTFLAIEFVATGLFITTHDAMHGTVCYRSRALNDAIGRVAISLYAWFDYDMLHRNHWAHHNHTGQPGRDPDFHRGNPHIAVWFAQFMLEYSTLLQFAKIFLASTLLQRVGGVPYANLCVYMAAAPILAAFRLFYFGTYLPHLPSDAGEVMHWQRSHSSDDPAWLTFLKCYHFGLHWRAMAAGAPASGEDPWRLWYWPGIKGRGEYVRLVLEEAGAAYEDVGVREGFKAVAAFCWEGGNEGFPVRAPPVLQRGAFSLCGTNVICSYLNRHFGWGPPTPEAQAHIDQLLAIVADAVGEGRLAFHPVDHNASHKTQVEESKPYIKRYGETRLPKYVQYFEAVLRANGGTPDAPGFLVGDAVTAADLSVYHFLAAAEHHYGDWYGPLDAPLAKAFAASIAARPRIAAYLASPRCQPWDADSMM